MRIMPSVVSIPPNMMTAALAMISASSRPPWTSARWPCTAPASSAIARSPAVVGARALTDAGHRLHDVPIPRQQAGDAPRVRPVESEALGHHGRRQRAGQLGAQLGPLAERRDQATGLGLDERLEALGDLAGAVRRDERLAVAGVGGAVERQHARADDAGRREARIVHRERGRVAEHLDGGRPPGDEEPTDRRYGGHR